MNKRSFLLLVLSFLIVALAQPDWSPFCCILASALGYAIFWKGMLACSSKKKRFFLALVWFGGVQVIHLSWLTADRYVGPVIYLLVVFIFLSLGGLFGFLSLFVQEPKQMRISRVLAIAGGWTIIEWSRLFFLSGFSWNPVGLALSGTLYGMQMASIVGVFGLSFWVIFTNLMALRMWVRPFAWGVSALWVVVALTPYLFGYAEVTFQDRESERQKSPPLSVVLVQTSLLPEEKTSFPGSIEPLSPLDQWRRMLSFLKKHDGKEIDLLVFSETVVPYGTDHQVYWPESVSEAFNETFSVELDASKENDAVGNSYWAQMLANHFNADVAIGLEDYDAEFAYNAGFLFSPNSTSRERYQKRVLVPFGEYIPFDWCRTLLAKYGIFDSFQPGSEAKVFPGKKVPLGMSICYEETFGHLMRETRLNGAALLINMTNDVWYPYSRLPYVHYLHGRMRSVECGMPIVRSSNTGVTCGIDSLGRVVGILDYERAGRKSTADALHLTLSSYTYPTLYTHLGDKLILVLGLSLVLVDILATTFSSSGLITKKLGNSSLRKNDE